MIDNDNPWIKRNITDEFRVRDITEMYESMGYEVKVEDYGINDCDSECNTCLQESPEKFKVIFTRKKTDSIDELFGDSN